MTLTISTRREVKKGEKAAAASVERCNKFKLKCVGVTKLRLTHKGMLLLHLSGRSDSRTNFFGCSAETRMKSLACQTAERQRQILWVFTGHVIYFLSCPITSATKFVWKEVRSAAHHLFIAAADALLARLFVPG